MPKIPGTPDKKPRKSLRRGRPKDETPYVRCPDCELNEHLDNVGNAVKGAPVSNCSGCVRGKIFLYTVEDIRRVEDPTKILTRLHEGRARLVRPSELVDPYLVKKKG